jgi:hypothetical protein
MNEKVELTISIRPSHSITHPIILSVTLFLVYLFLCFFELRAISKQEYASHAIADCIFLTGYSHLRNEIIVLAKPFLFLDT